MQHMQRLFTRLPLFVQFVIKQGWAALFGGLMVAALVVTTYLPVPGVNQYDVLFVAAIAFQVFMLATGLEKKHEVLIIAVFHLAGLCMELFKTSAAIGSWTYPGEAYFRIATVPLFSGFMYAAVGSYIARSWRVMRLRFAHYPHRIYTILLALGIYANFFAHHYLPDARLLLFAATIALYGKTVVHFTVFKNEHRMPLLLGFVLIAFFVWLAENIGTFTKVWLYPDQHGAWTPVSIQKLGSWLLLMIVSFIMVEVMHYLRTRTQAK